MIPTFQGDFDASTFNLDLNFHRRGNVKTLPSFLPDGQRPEWLKTILGGTNHNTFLP
jgi:hypothetical protein